MAGSQPLGELVVMIRAETAQFSAQMDAAKKGMDGVGTSGHSSASGVQHLGTALLRDLIPGLDISTKELNTLFTIARTGSGVLQTLAQGGLLVAGALGGYALGNALRNFRDLITSGYGIKDAFELAIGKTKDYEEETKKATEEQTKFVDQLNKTRAALLASAKAVDESLGKGSVLSARLAGNEPGAVDAQYQATLKSIEAERKAREQEIITSTKQGEERNKRLADSERKAASDRQNAAMEADLALQKLAEDASKNQVELWQKETESLVGEFQKRLTFRQQFDAQLGKGGLDTGGAGTIAQGFGAVSDFTKQVQKDARDIAGLRKEGLITDKQYFDAVTQLQANAQQEAAKLYYEWQLFPAVEDAIANAAQKMQQGFGPLGDVMQEATAYADHFLKTNDELADMQAKLVDQFSKVPAATGPAGVAVQKLANDYNDLAFQAAGATQQIYAAAAAMVYFHSTGGG